MKKQFERPLSANKALQTDKDARYARMLAADAER